jgi:hypothetical protein
VQGAGGGPGGVGGSLVSPGQVTDPRRGVGVSADGMVPGGVAFPRR